MKPPYRLERQSTASTDTPSARVVFEAPLDMKQWDEVRIAMLALLVEGVAQWEFDLRLLQRCLSCDIGMWVATNATVTNHGGALQFRVKRDSTVDKLIELTKLEKVLDIHRV